MKVFVKKLNSCPMRERDIQRYISFIVSNGHEIVRNIEDCDTILIWTCAFRSDVAENCLNVIREYREKYSAHIIVCGCLPDIYGEKLMEFGGIRVAPWRGGDYMIESLFGTHKLCKLLNSFIYADKPLCMDAEKYREENPDVSVTFHDQFVKVLISEGCPFSCSYCSERMAFPKFKSFSEDFIIAKTLKLVKESGCNNVMLMSDCLGEYGSDTHSNLIRLIKRILEENENIKFALSNLHPFHFLLLGEEILKLIDDDKICHINIPMQSASNRILSLMNRGYSKQNLEAILDSLQERGFTKFDTHIIVGFPTETEDDFNETLNFLLKYKPQYVLISKYFETPQAPSALLPDKIQDEEISRRANLLADELSYAGIICNYEDGKLSKDRIKRLTK